MSLIRTISGDCGPMRGRDRKGIEEVNKSELVMGCALEKEGHCQARPTPPRMFWPLKGLDSSG